MTLYERIKAMTVDEMASFLTGCLVKPSKITKEKIEEMKTLLLSEEKE